MVSSLTKVIIKMETIHKTALIIGAGPGGLATSKIFVDKNIDHFVLERGPLIADSWRKFYDSLTLHTGKHLSVLPGMKFKKETFLFPPKSQFLNYMENYTETYKLPIKVSTDVTKIEKGEKGVWVVHTEGNIYSCDYLVIGIGLAPFPFVPEIEGLDNFKGQIYHSIKYKNPESLKGKNCLVIGAGNSGAEIAYELSQEGIDTTIFIRSGANVSPLHILGVPIQYIGYLMSIFPKWFQLFFISMSNFFNDLVEGGPLIPRPSYSPLDRPPIIGKKFSKALKKGLIKYKNKITSYKENGVCFEGNEFKEIDTIILATGFKVNFNIFSHKVDRDETGFAKRKNRVEDFDHHNLFYVGQNYDSTGGLVNIHKDSQIIGKKIEEMIKS